MPQIRRVQIADPTSLGRITLNRGALYLWIVSVQIAFCPISGS